MKTERTKTMKAKGKRVLFLGGIFCIAFIVWTALIQIVDVQSIGQNGTDIGFATFNGWFHKLTGVHMMLYIVTDWLGLVPLVICMVFAGIGLVQLVQRRSFLHVDHDILFLGLYYIIVICAYLFFEMYPVNYRPILIDGVMEASYPSSTTLLVLSVIPTLVFQVKQRLKNMLVKKIICISANLFSVFMVVGRLVSGVHWFTDIVGGILFSIGLFYIYKGVIILNKVEENELGGCSNGIS